MANPNDACSIISNKGEIRGKVVLILQEGDCSFVDKARRVVEAGAVGIIFFSLNNAEASRAWSLEDEDPEDIAVPVCEYNNNSQYGFRNCK